MWEKWKDIMKCYPFEEKRLAKWEPPYIVQLKYDGDRCWTQEVRPNQWLGITSGGNIFHSIPHILEALDNSPLKDVKLDGELYNHKLFLEGGHELIHSVASRTTNLHPRHKELEFHVFDIKDKEMHQMERLLKLQEVKELEIPYIKVAPFWLCWTLDEIKDVYDFAIESRYEGIIVRHHKADYREKRSIFLMKFKPKRKDEYKIIGYNEEFSADGVPKGRLGSLILSSQDNDIFNVSAGLSHRQKEELWEIRGLLKGLPAIVHYQHLTERKIPKGTFDINIPDLGV